MFANESKPAFLTGITLRASFPFVLRAHSSELRVYRERRKVRKAGWHRSSLLFNGLG